MTTEQKLREAFRPTACGMPESIEQFQLALDAAYLAGEKVAEAKPPVPEQKLRKALERIASWDECDAKFRMEYGSNGERDYYRQLAREALAQPPAPEQQAPQGEERYFAYDPEGGGAELFQSLEGAMRFANESLQCHRDDAQHDGEWPEGVDRVCVGVITHVAAAKGSESEGFDYEMAPLAAPEAAKPEPCNGLGRGTAWECRNRHQCWEPCGELGHSEEHAKPAPAETQEAAKPETELAARLLAHAEAHSSVSPYDQEQQDWENDLRQAAALLAADRKAGGELDQSPVWNAQSEAIYWLNEIEKCQGGANGPTIKLRAAILWVFEPPYANTHPPAAQKLLPDEQVALLFRKGVGEWMTPGTAFAAGFRSAERAHGIGDQA